MGSHEPSTCYKTDRATSMILFYRRGYWAPEMWGVALKVTHLEMLEQTLQIELYFEVTEGDSVSAGCGSGLTSHQVQNSKA